MYYKDTKNYNRNRYQTFVGEIMNLHKKNTRRKNGRYYINEMGN